MHYSRIRYKQYDRSAIAGFISAVVILFIGSLIGGASLRSFIDLGSIVIVVGGTLSAILIQFNQSEIRRAYQDVVDVLTTTNVEISYHIEKLLSAAQLFRIHGARALDLEASSMPDSFSKKAMQLVSDGQSYEQIKRILDTDHRQISDNSERSIRVMEAAAQYAPAMGLIGTIIGLVQMLGALNEPAKVGPAMALALITTLYGAFLANLVFVPIAGKLKSRAESQQRIRRLVMEATLSISKLENSIILEQRLNSFVEAA